MCSSTLARCCRSQVQAGPPARAGWAHLRPAAFSWQPPCQPRAPNLRAAASLAGSGAAQTLDEVVESVRASAGVGIVFPTQIGRLELNYCTVLHALAGDGPKSGFQIGIECGGI